MSDVALRTVQLGKRYVIGGPREQYGTLRDTIARAARRPIERVRHPGAATHRSEELWALKDVDIEVHDGEVVGIVGPNGSGKSTLLKILSRITRPTEGHVEVVGRVASLLEVGTGFHPELTGRENVFLNGAILGMSRAEIKSKFDDIVDFSEIGRFLDTPVKRYSSGMYVRLAFAVAAHLESDILAVDEVLAVGDASFQKRCMSKMGDISSGGRTVLFVSHNLGAVKMLCRHAVLLESGRVRATGDTDSVLQAYMAKGVEEGGERTWSSKPEAPHGEHAWLHAVRVIQDGVCTEEVDIDRPFQFVTEFANESAGAKFFVNLSLHDAYGATVLETANTPGANALEERWFDAPLDEGLYRFSCTFPGNFLNEGRYFMTVLVGRPSPPSVELKADRVSGFEVVETGAMRTPGFVGKWNGVVRVPLEWRGETVPRSAQNRVCTSPAGRPIGDPGSGHDSSGGAA